MRVVLNVLVVQSLIVAALSASEPIPFDSPRWSFDAEESRIEEYQGRTSLFMRGGLALVEDSELLDGVIDFDIAFAEVRGFVGATWRVVDGSSREMFYIRSHQSGNPDANQYTPVFNGHTAWQLYHGEGYGAPVAYDFETWTPVRIVVSGSQAEVYIKDLETPALFIDELKREPVSGKVGLTAADFGPAHFADFRYTAMDHPELKGKVARQRTARPGSIMAWKVSTSFAEAALEETTEIPSAVTQGLEWGALSCETTGLANLSRLRALEPQRDTVFARVTVVSERAQTKGLIFGYSDRIRLYLNTRLLYSGDNGYRSRDYRYLGTIGHFDKVYLSLGEGRNELWLAVSETFGGWGVQAAFDDTDGIRVLD